MAYSVPLKCLVPVDAAGFIIGKAGSTVKQICEETGAAVSMLGASEVPRTLGDKVVSVTGNAQQKVDACRHLVDKLRHIQQVKPQEAAVFVTIVPQASARAIVGEGGEQLRSIGLESGAELLLSRDSIEGTRALPLCITGIAQCVVEACAIVDAILQEQCALGELTKSDFELLPGPDRVRPGRLVAAPAGSSTEAFSQDHKDDQQPARAASSSSGRSGERKSSLRPTLSPPATGRRAASREQEMNDERQVQETGPRRVPQQSPLAGFSEAWAAMEADLQGSAALDGDFSSA
ncbi:unnamed protein product, partial [Polarella glacialis]